MKKRLLLLVIIVMVLVLLTGCNPTFIPTPILTILRHSWLVNELVPGNWWVEITGEAENTGNVDLVYAEIWATFYNADNSVICKDRTNQLDILVGEIWHFEIIYWQTIRPDHYELAVSDLSY